MIFANGEVRGLKKVAKLLQKYKEAAGQDTNKSKCNLFMGGITLGRRRAITQELGVEEGALPETYLGVPIFMVYKWPMSLIEEAEKAMRNLLWTGNPAERKKTTVSWDKVCKPVEEGGLGIRKLKDINIAMLMKLAWRCKTGDDEFSVFIRSKFLNKDAAVIQYYKCSSAWPGIMLGLKEVNSRSQWAIGNGAKVDIWRDNWAGTCSIQEGLKLSDGMLKGCRSKVMAIITEHVVDCPDQLQTLVLNAGVDLTDMVRTDEEDTLVRCPDITGEFSTKSAFCEVRRKRNTISWHKNVWHRAVHPKFSGTAWKLFHNSAATEASAKGKGIKLASRCPICCCHEESLKHLLFECPRAIQVWGWLMGKFKFRGECNDRQEALKKAVNRSTIVQQLWNASCIAVMVDHSLETKKQGSV
ncbi:hypothetical protein IFM89_003262 [Coptis chinensis]|uniref:Reverse transcriptase zinc-binding domain-containing protein n=1 Tax=Coptis chinensis TaxID=261450 RepID=A0A835I6Z1_9MAGN|nr:hypothetical protein IFM89_003262 [Coptis chinensis]